MRSLLLTQAVVITHPHPLYGGDMDNLVVGEVKPAAVGGYDVSFVLFDVFRGKQPGGGMFPKNLLQAATTTNVLGLLVFAGGVLRKSTGGGGSKVGAGSGSSAGGAGSAGGSQGAAAAGGGGSQRGEE